MPKVETQTDQVTCPSSHSWQTAEPEFEHRSTAFPKEDDLSTVLYHHYSRMGVQTAGERRRRRDSPRHWPRVWGTTNLSICYPVGAQYSQGEGWKVRGRQAYPQIYIGETENEDTRGKKWGLMTLAWISIPDPSLKKDFGLISSHRYSKIRGKYRTTLSEKDLKLTGQIF